VLFRSECFLNLPVAARIADLDKHCLVFIVYLAKENQKNVPEG